MNSKDKAGDSIIESAEPVAIERRELLQRGIGLGVAGIASPVLLAGCGKGDGSQQGWVPGSPPQVNTTSSFVLPVLPDTQFYSRYASVEASDPATKLSPYMKQFGSEPFDAQTRWIAANAAALKIPFVVHLGDVVDQVTKRGEWEIANKAMNVLEAARVPYSILAGNHDVLYDADYANPASQRFGTDADRNPKAEPYLQWFSAERAKKQVTFKGRDPSGFHEYHIFEAEGQKFMVLSLSWRISDAGIAWANKVIADNPTVPVILSNHQLLNIANDGKSPLETAYGLMLWEKLIRHNDQIFMTLNGHHHGSTRLQKINNFGNAVEIMVLDYQMYYQGGNGLMRLYEFDLTNNRILALTMSPWVQHKPKASLVDFDQALLTDELNQFSIPMDFKKRFSGFAKNFGPAQSTAVGSLVEKARQQLLKDYAAPAPRKMVEAKDSEDYPKVANTVAHWRFTGGAAGAAVPVGFAVKDETGANPITRAPLNIDGVEGAQEGDIVWSADAHRYSAARGSVEFRNTKKMVKYRNPQNPIQYIKVEAPRMSYFTTAPDAPANKVMMENGYTVEAFIKIGKDWKADLNRWMNIMTRDGEQMAYNELFRDFSALQESLTIFSISNLREVQWSATPVDKANESKSSWSGEIMIDKWVHVAIVNDATSGDITMYIEGAAMLRGVMGKKGIATVGRPWVIGGGAWPQIDPENRRFLPQRDDGWLGSIGEIRIVAAPLKPEQWLTARRA